MVSWYFELKPGEKRRLPCSVKNSHEIFTMGFQLPETGRKTHKAVFRFTLYYASQLGVLHDLDSAWTVRPPVSN